MMIDTYFRIAYPLWGGAGHALYILPLFYLLFKIEQKSVQKRSIEHTQGVVLKIQ